MKKASLQRMIPSAMVSTSWWVWYGQRALQTSFILSGYPEMIMSVRACRSGSSWRSAWLSSFFSQDSCFCDSERHQIWSQVHSLVSTWRGFLQEPSLWLICNWWWNHNLGRQRCIHRRWGRASARFSSEICSRDLWSLSMVKCCPKMKVQKQSAQRHRQAAYVHC